MLAKSLKARWEAYPTMFGAPPARATLVELGQSPDRSSFRVWYHNE